jgi:hypothetical protein
LALGLGSDPGLAGPEGDMLTLIAEGTGWGQGLQRLMWGEGK